jgi:hypothetical protein
MDVMCSFSSYEADQALGVPLCVMLSVSNNLGAAVFAPAK